MTEFFIFGWTISLKFQSPLFVIKTKITELKTYSLTIRYRKYFFYINFVVQSQCLFEWFSSHMVYSDLNYTKYTKLSRLNLELNGYSGGLPCSSLDNEQGWPCGGVFCVDDVPACHWGARCPIAAEPSGSAAVIVAQHPVGEAWPVCQSKNSLHGNSKAHGDLPIRKELNWNALSGTLTVPALLHL